MNVNPFSIPKKASGKTWSKETSLQHICFFQYMSELLMLRAQLLHTFTLMNEITYSLLNGKPKGFYVSHKNRYLHNTKRVFCKEKSLGRPSKVLSNNYILSNNSQKLIWIVKFLSLCLELSAFNGMCYVPFDLISMGLIRRLKGQWRE